ncbi:hypothetical protein [Saccharothrix obliqua]|uniref:hypothetical protein n=1 Tax=Saccharothrix obliqua TaxID=2861747 RepID=UPI001C5DD21E|nr:hypothetical protein [Saccharothrix obliqua]MBW4722322.1 hypothetical protein [Saccharothrix obliqua]
MLRYIAANADRVAAMVMGEYERALLDGAQVRELRAVLERYGAQLWLPEAQGLVLAARSQTEVIRFRHRVVTAMRRQTVEQGRYLGGDRPTATVSLTPGRIRSERWRDAPAASLCSTASAIAM